jgi:hypothetical protein
MSTDVSGSPAQRHRHLLLVPAESAVIDVATISGELTLEADLTRPGNLVRGVSLVACGEQLVVLVGLLDSGCLSL